MKTLKKLSLSLLTLGAIGIAGCQDYEPFSLEETRKGAFEKNFLEQYGKYLDPDMNWDLSDHTRCGKYDANDVFGHVFGNNNSNPTRAAVEGTVEIGYDTPGYSNLVNKDRWYDVQKGTLDWMKLHLKEFENNTAHTNPFYLRMPDELVNGGHLVIIPIYQGNAVMRWDLHMVAGGKDIKLWQRHERILAQTPDISAEWDYSKWKNPKDLADKGTMEALNIHSGVIDVNMANVFGSSTDREFYFYLDITHGHVQSEYKGETNIRDLIDIENGELPKTPAGIPGWWWTNEEAGEAEIHYYGDYAYTGTKQKSTEGMMVVLPCEVRLSCSF